MADEGVDPLHLHIRNFSCNPGAPNCYNIHNMKNTSEDNTDYSAICVKQCHGACCDPWWGIINYSVIKKNGPGGEKAFLNELVKGIRIREKRIVNAYVTRETPARHLFTRPQSYDIIVRDIREEANALRLDLILMFAFRCSFLSKDKTCLIHPTITDGPDIRPPQCDKLGTPGIKSGQEGYCRIISVAAGEEGPNAPSIDEAIETGNTTTRRYLSEGSPEMEDAAEKVLARLRAYYRDHPETGRKAMGIKKPGRNDPCHCGSGKKYKKCHGA